LGGSAPKGLGEHRRHHESHPHAEAGARLPLRPGRALQGHRGLHLEELVHVVEDAQPALVVDRLLHLRRRGDRIDVEIGQPEPELCEIAFEKLLESVRKVAVARRQVEDGVDLLSHEVVEAGDDHPIQVFGHGLGGEDPLRSDEAVDEQHRLEDPEVEDAERPQPDQAELPVPEGDRVAGAPGQVRKDLHVREIDFRPQRARHPPGDAEDLRQQRDVGRFEGMASGAERVIGLAVIEKDGGLAFSDGHLRAPLDFAGTRLRDAMNQLFSRFIEPFDHFQKNDIVGSHGSPMRGFERDGDRHSRRAFFRSRAAGI